MKRLSKKEQSRTKLISSCLQHFARTESVKCALAPFAPFLGVLNNVGDTPIITAVRTGNLYPLRLLAQLAQMGQKNKFLDMRDRKGYTALHLATFLENQDMCSTLIESEASVSVLDALGSNVLHYVCKDSNQHALLNIFLASRDRLDLKAALDTLDRNGHSPLHVAVLNGAGSIVKILMDTPECDPNLLDQRGFSPLHHVAIYHTRTSMLSPLLTRADPNKAAEKGGILPIHLAIVNRNMIATSILAKHSDLTRRSSPLELIVRPKNILFSADRLRAAIDWTVNESPDVLLLLHANADQSSIQNSELDDFCSRAAAQFGFQEPFFPARAERPAWSFRGGDMLNSFEYAIGDPWAYQILQCGNLSKEFVLRLICFDSLKNIIDQPRPPSPTSILLRYDQD